MARRARAEPGPEVPEGGVHQEVERALGTKDAPVPEGRVRQEVERALGSTAAPVLRDFAGRMNELLLLCAVVPSARAGVLGDLARLAVAIDGSSVESQANGRGRRPCDHDRDDRACRCARSYADPHATWGWDSHRERSYFGHRLHAAVTRHAGVDLPLQLLLDGAHTPDALLGVRAVVDLRGQLADALPDARIHAVVADCGYDATAFHELVVRLGAAPIVPLHPGTRVPTETRGVRRDAQGRPLCAGNLPMRLHGFTPRTKKVVYNCPVKRPGRDAGAIVMRARVEECPLDPLCEPESVMGPLVYLSVGDDPRLNPPIPRGTPAYEALYASRTAAERFFSVVKGAGLGARPHRRRHVLHVVALCHALRLHARAWVSRRLSSGTGGGDALAALEHLLREAVQQAA